MVSAWQTTIRIFGWACFCPGLLIGNSIAWADAQPVAASSAKDRYVVWGWGDELSVNQIIRRWLERDRGNQRLVPRREWNGGALPQLRRSRDALRRVKDGLGMDYRIGSSGGLHLNIYSRRKIKRPGVRWQLGQTRADVSIQRWTLGGSMQRVRTEDGKRFISFIPQLIVNPDGAHAKLRRWRLKLEYGYWFGGEKRAAAAERVLQASVAARF